MTPNQGFNSICRFGGLIGLILSKAKDANRPNKVIKMAESVVGSKLVTLEEVAEDKMLAKLHLTYHYSTIHQHFTHLPQYFFLFYNYLSILLYKVLVFVCCI